MKTVKKYLREIFIDGLSGMATGLFATLIIGTIMKQIGALIPGTIGEYLVIMGGVASALTGAGIGLGTANKLNAERLNCLETQLAKMCRNHGYLYNDYLQE